MPAANAPKADEAATEGDASHSATPITIATPPAVRIATSGSSGARSTRTPERAVFRSARNHVMVPTIGPGITRNSQQNDRRCPYRRTAPSRRVLRVCFNGGHGQHY